MIAGFECKRATPFHLWNAREKGREGTDGMGITGPEGGKKKRDPGKEKGIAESEENPREGIEKRELNRGGQKKAGAEQAAKWESAVQRFGDRQTGQSLREAREWDGRKEGRIDR